MRTSTRNSEVVANVSYHEAGPTVVPRRRGTTVGLAYYLILLSLLLPGTDLSILPEFAARRAHGQLVTMSGSRRISVTAYRGGPD